MMTTEGDITKISESVHSLQRDMAQIGSLVDRLDITIEKLTEVSSSISQLLAIQGSRLEFQEKIQEKLQDLVERRRQETDDNIKAVFNRVERVERDLHEDVADTENKIIKKMNEIQRSTAAQNQKFNEDITKRIDRLEKWIWTAIGAGGVFLWILNSIDITKMFV